MVNTMLCKTLTMQMTNSYLDITHDEQYYTWLVDMDVMKCLLSKGHILTTTMQLKHTALLQFIPSPKWYLFKVWLAKYSNWSSLWADFKNITYVNIWHNFGSNMAGKWCPECPLVAEAKTKPDKCQSSIFNTKHPPISFKMLLTQSQTLLQYHFLKVKLYSKIIQQNTRENKRLCLCKACPLHRVTLATWLSCRLLHNM